MSNEPIRKQASFDKSVVLPAPGVRPADSARPDLAPDPIADAELVLAAMRRIEVALRNDYAAPPLTRLRERLDATAGDIAEARLALALDDEYGARTLDIGALLARLEQRVTSMLAIANEPAQARAEPASAERVATSPAPEPPASHDTTQQIPQESESQPERVPTVGEVVSRMNLPAALAEESAAPSPDIFSKAPSVAMLEAMVEALTAPPAATPAVETRAVDNAAAEMGTPEAAVLEDLSWPLAEIVADAEAPASEAPSPETIAAAPEPDTAPPTPERPAFEDDLLADFALIDSMPYLPEDIGTAVIFDTATGQRIETSVEGDAVVLAPAAAVPASPFAAALVASAGCCIVVTRMARPLLLAAPAMADAPAAEAASEIVVAPMEAAHAEPVWRPDPLAPLRMRSTVETIALFS